MEDTRNLYEDIFKYVWHEMGTTGYGYQEYASLRKGSHDKFNFDNFVEKQFEDDMDKGFKEKLDKLNSKLNSRYQVKSAKDFFELSSLLYDRTKVKSGDSISDKVSYKGDKKEPFTKRAKKFFKKMPTGLKILNGISLGVLALEGLVIKDAALMAVGGVVFGALPVATIAYYSGKALYNAHKNGTLKKMRSSLAEKLGFSKRKTKGEDLSRERTEGLAPTPTEISVDDEMAPMPTTVESISEEAEFAPTPSLSETVKPDKSDMDKSAEEEAHRKAAEEEARRKVAEEEARRKAAEEEARRKVAEEEARRKAAEEEVRRKAAEEEVRRKAAEEEARRKAAEEEARRKAAEEETRRKATEEEARRKAAEEEARRKAAEEEARRKAAEEETRRKASEEEARTKKSEGDMIETLAKSQKIAKMEANLAKLSASIEDPSKYEKIIKETESYAKEKAVNTAEYREAMRERKNAFAKLGTILDRKHVCDGYVQLINAYKKESDIKTQGNVEVKTNDGHIKTIYVEPSYGNTREIIKYDEESHSKSR